MPGEYAANLIDMLAELHYRCPVVCPNTTPHEYCDIEHGTALLALCADAEERKSLAAKLARERATMGGVCELSGRTVETNELRFVSIWKLSPAIMTYSLRRVAFVCKEVALLTNAPAFFDRYTNPKADVEELTELAMFFCAVNKHDDKAKDPLAARTWLHECMNLAYCCQIVAGSLDNNTWHITGPDNKSLPQTATAIAEHMLSRGAPSAKTPKAKGGKAKAKATTPKGTGSSSGKAKKKKRRQDESDDDDDDMEEA